MKEKHVDPEEAMKQVQKIFKKRGTDRKSTRLNSSH